MMKHWIHGVHYCGVLYIDARISGLLPVKSIIEELESKTITFSDGHVEGVTRLPLRFEESFCFESLGLIDHLFTESSVTSCIFSFVSLARGTLKLAWEAPHLFSYT